MTRSVGQRRDSSPIEILPVLDLKQGWAVRAVGGSRDKYRPITSKLTPDGCPIALAESFLQLGFRSLYLADLDAIGGSAPNWQVFEMLAMLELDLWIDAGVNDGPGAKALATIAPEGRTLRVIAGLESLPDIDRLQGMVEQIGAGRLVFSLDLFEGRPLSALRGQESSNRLAFGPAHTQPLSRGSARQQEFFQEANFQQALAIVEQAVTCGVRQIIVLDLARVGSGAGVGHFDLLRAIVRRWPAVELISGGGVRSRADLVELSTAGCRAALVSSALHDGGL